MSFRRLAWLCLVALLGSPLVDPHLMRTQPRFVLLHVPLWIVMGYVAGRHLRAVSRPRAEPWNPLGLSGLVLFAGALAFWMIPRSVDSAALSRGVDQLLHASLLVAGFTLAWSMPIMPFVLRAALGIYGASMVLSLGALYTYYSALLCGTFTLAEQRQTGRGLSVLFPFIVVALLVLGVRSLARERPGSRTSP